MPPNAMLSERQPKSHVTPALRLAGGREPVAADALAVFQLLEEARALLAELKRDRSRIESRLAEFGRTDPIAAVKGKSALDKAVDATQAVIEHLDAINGEHR